MVPTFSFFLLAEKQKGTASYDKLAFFIALCLVARFGSAFLTSSQILQEAPFLALLIPVALLFLRKGGLETQAFLKTFFCALPYVGALFLSFLFAENPQGLDSGAIQLGNTCLLFLISAAFACCKDDVFLLRIMRATALLSAPLFLYVLATQQGAYVWGRWEPYEQQPNWWGMMALALSWCAFSWKNIIVRFFFLGLGFLFMYLAQARGSVVAIVPAFLLCSGYFFPLSQKKVFLLLGGCLFAFVAIFVADIVLSFGFFGWLSDFLLNDVMRMNDPLRGAGSGMSGRGEGYKVAFDAFKENPLFGSGFSEFGFVHNGFLLTLAESGIFGLLGLLALFVGGLRGYGKMRDSFGIGLIVSYMTVLLTFPRTVNLNMTSLLFVFVMMRGIALLFLSRRDAPPKKILFGSHRS